MAERRVGLWLIGGLGGVGSTTALGLAATAANRSAPTGMVTALDKYSSVPFDPFSAFVVGGHDIRQTSFTRSLAELHGRSGVFSEHLLADCQPTLESWSKNIRPGVIFRPSPIVAALADRSDVVTAATPRAAITRIQADFREFQKAHKLDQVVVLNSASTEPPFELGQVHASAKDLEASLDRTDPAPLPTSSLYAYAAIDAGFPYVNLTPSLGASIPALDELAKIRKVPLAGKDLKTGETLLKSVLAPMFARRNLRVLSWVGHNILGNRDGLVLNDPNNKQSKVKTKDALLGELLGYKPQSHVSIEYIESLDDWKTAWDHIHFEGFLGTKMTLQFTWQGCDSILAAPLALDLARLVLLAQRRGEVGIRPYLAPYFKSPAGVSEHDFGRQFDMLDKYLTAGHTTA